MSDSTPIFIGIVGAFVVAFGVPFVMRKSSWFRVAVRRLMSIFSAFVCVMILFLMLKIFVFESYEELDGKLAKDVKTFLVLSLLATGMVWVARRYWFLSKHPNEPDDDVY